MESTFDVRERRPAGVRPFILGALFSKHTVGRQAEVENRMEKRDIFVNEVESKICSVKQSLIELHKEVISLPTMHTRSCNNDKQASSPRDGQRFFSSLPNGVFNLVTSHHLCLCLSGRVRELGGSLSPTNLAFFYFKRWFPPDLPLIPLVSKSKYQVPTSLEF